MRSLSLSLLLITAATAATQIHAQQGQAPYTVKETGQGFGNLQQAIDAIGGGTGTILMQPGIYEDCGVQKAGSIAYKAALLGETIFRGVTCEDKAAIVMRGNSASVDGIIFENMGVADGNGAGIRLEKGNLQVTRSIFRNSEQGILTASDPSGSITIDQTTFSRLGRCDRGLSCAHSIYIGDYGSLTVTRTRFEKGAGGHYLKTRTPRVKIQGNAFDDTQGRTTNYMIDLSNGSTGVISGNMFVQGRDKENYSAFITVAPEGRENSSNGLSITNNDAEIAPGINRNTIFLANWSDDRVNLGSNRLGKGLTAYEKR